MRRFPEKNVHQQKRSPTTVTANTPPEVANVIFNENFIRHMQQEAAAVKVIEKTPMESPVVPTPTPIPEIATPLTVLHNDRIVIGDQVEKINFIDTLNAKFLITGQGSKYVQTLSSGKPLIGRQQANVVVLVKAPSIMRGIVCINQLPLNPITMPPDTPDSEQWKYEHYLKNPDHNYYGWYVYQLITHNWGLDNINNYTLELIDLHTTTNAILTGEYDLSAYRYCVDNNDPQVDMPEHEGLDANTIILRGWYKPDYNYFYIGGAVRVPEIEYIDEENRTVNSNLIFHYTLTKGQ